MSIYGQPNTIAISAVTTAEIPARNCTPANSRYHHLFNPAAAAPDKWISFPTSFVAGKTHARKQITLHGAARLRGIKIKTRIRGEVGYVMYVGPDPRPKV